MCSFESKQKDGGMESHAFINTRLLILCLCGINLQY